jgi:fido (protein-threonine AMPylation protein)
MFVAIIVSVTVFFLSVLLFQWSNWPISSQSATDNVDNACQFTTDSALSNKVVAGRMSSFLVRSSSVHQNVDEAETYLVPHYQTATSLHIPHSAAESSAEALAALSLAREMLSHGKTDRALKIFLHALALYPSHPDVLNEYGEFLEHKRSDVISAEHLYCQALVVSPSHSRALDNYRRTAPVVSEIDRAHFQRIDQKRDTLLHVPEGHPGLRRLVEENYYRHLYHATALEGNTFTLAQTRSFVDTHIVVAGKSIIEHNEILGMEAALSFLNSSLIKRIGAISVQDILDIHRRVLGFVDPFGAGAFRTTQVFVADYVPPPASEVEQLVSSFINWLNSDEALSLHPVELAALAHYRLVHIHPFYDGNGRTSRLLMNLVLMQAGYPPIIVPVSNRAEYYEHLKTANDGDIRPFVRFIARCTERTIDEYLWVSVENINRTYPEISLNLDADRTIQPDRTINVPHGSGPTI